MPSDTYEAVSVTRPVKDVGCTHSRVEKATQNPEESPGVDSEGEAKAKGNEQQFGRVCGKIRRLALLWCCVDNFGTF